MKRANIISMTKAILCADCACVSDGGNVCPACASRAVLPLHMFLERRRVGEVIREENVAVEART